MPVPVALLARQVNQHRETGRAFDQRADRPVPRRCGVFAEWLLSGVRAGAPVPVGAAAPASPATCGGAVGTVRGAIALPAAVIKTS